MRSIVRCLGVVLALCLAMSAAAAADDLYPPDWRDSEGATFQHWTFSTDANPAAPEVVRNAYGDPIAVISVGEMGIGWVDVDIPSYGSMTGVWDLGSCGTIDLYIPNRPALGPYKDVWVQVTYLVDPFEEPLVDVPGAELIGEPESQVVEELPGFGQWVCAVSKWRIYPNPDNEVVQIVAGGFGSVIDQIVVDTKCVPEPSAFVSLLAGAVGMLISRRRRK